MNSLPFPNSSPHLFKKALHGTLMSGTLIFVCWVATFALMMIESKDLTGTAVITFFALMGTMLSFLVGVVPTLNLSRQEPYRVILLSVAVISLLAGIVLVFMGLLAFMSIC